MKIVASGGLNETRIDQLVKAGAPIDVFGVGTDMSVSADAPALDVAYKLTEYAGSGRMKLSAKKATMPGRKQVFRRTVNGLAAGDVIARRDETHDGTPLLECVMRGGKRTKEREPRRYPRTERGDDRRSAARRPVLVVDGLSVVGWMMGAG